MSTSSIPPIILEKMVAASPFNAFYPGQPEIIFEVLKAYWSGKKWAVLESGTGTGKSVMGYAAARVIADNLEARAVSVADEHGGEAAPKSITIITKTRNLQQQYEDSFNDVPNLSVDVAALWGKSHYSDIPDDPSPDQKIEKCGKGCPGMTYKHESRDCPYGIAFRKYMDPSTLSVANNALFMSAPPFSSCAQVLVVDECHKIPDTLVEASAVELSSKRLLRIMEEHFIEGTDYMRSCVTYEEGLAESKHSLPKIIQHLANIAGFAITTIIPALESRIEVVLASAPQMTVGVEKQVKKLDRAKSSVVTMMKRINLIRSSEEQDGGIKWVCWKEVDEKKDRATGAIEKTSIIHVKPLDPLPMVVDDMTRNSEFVIYMSATCDYDQFVKQLALNSDEGSFIQKPTEFSVDNRKVVRLDVSGMNYRNKAELLSEDGAFTNQIRSIAMHKDNASTRGLIHSVSYANAKIIRERLRSMGRQVVTPTSGTVVDREYLSQFNDNCILVSPSLAEGVDLADDLCRWQIILKVPYPSLGDPWIKTKMESDSDWYSSQAVMDILQMAGRGVRHSEDYCTTYVLDSNFGRLDFPSWFTDAVIKG